MTPRNKFILVGNLVIFSAIALGAVIYSIGQYRNEKERSVFQTHIEIYLEKPQNVLVDRSQVPQDSIAISGKLVIVNLRERKIDPIFSDLPGDLKPEIPEQVKTILWLDCQHEAMNKYSDGTIAFSTECELTFIDLINKKYLWRDRVRALPPARKKADGKDAFADPGDEVLRYFESIPRKE